MNKYLKSKFIFFFIKTINIKIVLLCCVSFFFSTCGTQLKSFGKYEKRWAYTHPIAAVKLKSIKGKCDVVYSEVKNSNSLDKYENGGKLDAFRHMFYMAYFSSKINSKKVKRLGIAHEKDNYLAFLKNIDEEAEMADSISCVMDLLNNDIGIDLMNSINEPLSINQIKELCFEKINTGQSFFMKRNSIGNYLTCDGTIINFNLYIKKWNVPKCLIRK